MSTLTVVLQPGYTFGAGETVDNSKLNLLGNPAILLTGTISATSIAAGAITPDKINAATVGAGLTGGAGVAIAVAVDGATLVINGGLVQVAVGGIALDKLSVPGFSGCNVYSDGLPGLVPTPRAGQQTWFLRGDGQWADVIGQAIAAAQTSVFQVPLEIFKSQNFY